MEKKLKAVAYARSARRESGCDGCLKQLRTMVARSLERNVEIIEMHADNGVAGTRLPKFLESFTSRISIGNEEIDALFVTDMCRISRNSIVRMGFIEELNNRGVKVIECNDSQDIYDFILNYYCN